MFADTGIPLLFRRSSNMARRIGGWWHIAGGAR